MHNILVSLYSRFGLSRIQIFEVWQCSGRIEIVENSSNISMLFEKPQLAKTLPPLHGKDGEEMERGNVVSAYLK